MRAAAPRLVEAVRVPDRLAEVRGVLRQLDRRVGLPQRCGAGARRRDDRDQQADGRSRGQWDCENHSPANPSHDWNHRRSGLSPFPRTRQSVASITSDALITTITSALSVIPRSSTASTVIEETTRWPDTSSSTFAIACPRLIARTVPRSWFRALSFIRLPPSDLVRSDGSSTNSNRELKVVRDPTGEVRERDTAEA